MNEDPEKRMYKNKKTVETTKLRSNITNHWFQNEWK